MSDRKWHLEHRSGREWTGDELDAVMRAVLFDDPYNRCEDVFIDCHGNVALMDESCDIYYAATLDEGSDMVVVWDEDRAIADGRRRAHEEGQEKSMNGIHIGRRTHSEEPLLVRPGLEFRDVVPDGVDDSGTARFAVTIASDVCDVTFHGVRAEHIQRFAGGAFDLALWRSE